MTRSDPTSFPGSAAWVAVGGAAGAGVRWAVVTLAASTGAFPWPTLVVNVVGCFVVGRLAGAKPSTLLLLGIGFAGGLTTFSTLSVELTTLLRGGDGLIAGSYLGASLVLGIGAVVGGRRLAS